MQDSVEEKDPEPRVQRTRPGWLQSEAPNVVTLVRVCGNAFGVSRHGGDVVIRRLPAPKLVPRGEGSAQVVQLGRPANG